MYTSPPLTYFLRRCSMYRKCWCAFDECGAEWGEKRGSARHPAKYKWRRAERVVRRTVGAAVILTVVCSVWNDPLHTPILAGEWVSPIMFQNIHFPSTLWLEIGCRDECRFRHHNSSPSRRSGFCYSLMGCCHMQHVPCCCGGLIYRWVCYSALLVNVLWKNEHDPHGKT